MLTNQDQDAFDTLLQNNRLLRRTYRQMNEELQALNRILQQKLQKSPPGRRGCIGQPLPTFWLIQNDDLPTPEEFQALQRCNSKLHHLNATLAQFQMTTFKKLLDVMRPEKRPEKQTQTRGEPQDQQRQVELQSLKEQLQKELEQLRSEASVAQKEERLTLSRCNCLKICVRMTELHNNNRRRLLQQVRDNQVLTQQVKMLEDELQRRRSVPTPPSPGIWEGHSKS